MEDVIIPVKISAELEEGSTAKIGKDLEKELTSAVKGPIDELTKSLEQGMSRSGKKSAEALKKSVSGGLGDALATIKDVASAYDKVADSAKKFNDVQGTLQSQLQTIQSDISTLKSRSDDAVSKAAELPKLLSEAAELESQLTSKTQEYSDLEQKTSELLAKKESLFQKSIAYSVNSVNKQRDLVSGLRTELADLQKKKALMEEVGGSARKQLLIDTQIKNKQAEITAEAHKLGGMKTAELKYDRAYENTLKEIEKLQPLNELEDEIVDAQNRLEDLNATIEVYRDLIREAQEDSTLMPDKLASEASLKETLSSQTLMNEEAKELEQNYKEAKKELKEQEQILNQAIGRINSKTKAVTEEDKAVKKVVDEATKEQQLYRDISNAVRRVTEEMENQAKEEASRTAMYQKLGLSVRQIKDAESSLGSEILATSKKQRKFTDDVCRDFTFYFLANS